ncbi:hypothetical protein KGM_211183 [Danaus plexippus plexippus]|uniref:T-box domain-containing protein n=1 Tax=Danaus plexippus plexippus TaxID=278856 RepID=A0A212EST3_DANPL|nr:hypothetical protein KGM_211183 [Danaus plexippus plexippus]
MDVWPSRMVAEEGRTRATDFSIAAIMARSSDQPRSPGASSPYLGPSSRQSSPASLSSPASSCRSPAPEEDVEVDVEQCSDGERDASDTAAPSPAPSSELGERDTPSPARPLPTPVTSCNCEELLSVDCQLETKELWDKFHDLGTEMIITKTGRNFPHLRHLCAGDRDVWAGIRHGASASTAMIDDRCEPEWFFPGSKRVLPCVRRDNVDVTAKAPPPQHQLITIHPFNTPAIFGRALDSLHVYVSSSCQISCERN